MDTHLTAPFHIDGSPDPNAGTANDVPFNWLYIRYYSIMSDTLVVSSYMVVISFKALNYNINPPGF